MPLNIRKNTQRYSAHRRQRQTSNVRVGLAIEKHLHLRDALCRANYRDGLEHAVGLRRYYVSCVGTTASRPHYHTVELGLY